jgi:hypothetical protein
VVVGVALTGCAEDVGTPPGLGSARAMAVNEHGVAAVQAWADGLSPSSGGSSAWTLAPDGAWTPVAPPGAGPHHRVVPEDINAGGTVVGTYEDPAVGLASWTAFAWHPVDGSRVLEPLPGDDLVHIAGIDESGTIVGDSSGDDINAVRWEPGATEPTPLAVPAGFSFAQADAINDNGVIAGVADRDSAAVVWEPPAYEPRVLEERPPLTVRDIDEDGTVVGSSSRHDEGPVGVRWSPEGELTVLEDFLPMAIDDGAMVGNFVGTPLLWPAGADAPEPLGSTTGRDASVVDIAGGHMVGYLLGPDDVHAARFTPNP